MFRYLNFNQHFFMEEFVNDITHQIEGYYYNFVDRKQYLPFWRF